MIKSKTNYIELVIRLAKTDFKLRYHGSTLGYVWVILKPLLMFTILNFVFSNIFAMKSITTPYYPLELLTALLLFQFFAEGTMNGMMSLVNKAPLVTRIYIPRFTIVLASTVNSLFIFTMNLIVLVFFFFIYHKAPSILGISTFILYSILLYILILIFSFITAPLFVRFRDLGNIWEVLLSVLMYASPIVYPLSLLSLKMQNLLLLNPLAFIIHFSKQALISNSFTNISNFIILSLSIILMLLLSFLVFKKYEKKVAELI